MAQQTYLYVFGRNKNVNLKYFLNIFHREVLFWGKGIHGRFYQIHNYLKIRMAVRTQTIGIAKT